MGLSYKGEEPTIKNIEMPPGKILVQLRESQDETEGGVLLSKSATKPHTTVGEVVAVGGGVPNPKGGEPLPLEIEVGDSVHFRFGSEVKLEVDKKDYRVVD